MEPYIRPKDAANYADKWQYFNYGGKTNGAISANLFDTLASQLKNGQINESQVQQQLLGNAYATGDGTTLTKSFTEGNPALDFALDAVRIAAGKGSANPNNYLNAKIPEYTIGAGYRPAQTADLTKETSTSSGREDPSKGYVFNPTDDAAQRAYNERLGNMTTSASTTNSTNIPALGTPEYTNYLVDQGNALGLNLNQYRVPTNASSANNIPGVNLPTNSPTTGSIANAVAGTSGVSDLLTSQLAQLDQQRKDAQVQADKNQSLFKDLLGSVSSSADVRAEKERELNANATQFFNDQKARVIEIQSLTEQYNNLVAQKDAQIAQSQGSMASTSFIDNQIAQINRNAAPELNRISSNINAKSATLQALQGNFDRAQDYINQAVQDATADSKFKMDSFAMIYQMNQDTLDRLDSQYKDALDKAYDLAKTQHANDLAMKQTLAQIQLDNPQVAIDINGSLESALSLVQGNPKATGGQVIGSAETGYSYLTIDPKTGNPTIKSLTGGTGSTGSENSTSVDFLIPIMQAAVDAGGDANTASLQAIQYAESKGINLSAKERALVNQVASQITATPTPPVSTQPKGNPALEAAIKSIYASNPETRSGFNAGQKLKDKLQAQGFSDYDIARSSAGNIVDKAVTGVSAFFSNLFGR